MAKVSLRSRLFFSHLAVMGIGILTLAVFGRLYTPRLFVVSLERYENGVLSVQRRTQLVKGFEAAWSRGMLWAILVGGGNGGRTELLGVTAHYSAPRSDDRGNAIVCGRSFR
jgi:hypothetical protein